MNHRQLCVLKTTGVIFFLLGFWPAALCQAGILPSGLDWQTGGQWSVYGYGDINHHGTDDEAVSDTRVLLENTVGLTEQGVELRADLEWRFQAFSGMDHHSQGDVRFRDVYAEVKGDQFDFSAGQKRVTWGKLDDLVILDRVSPQDLTHFVLYDKQERKDPALMVQHQWFGWDGFQLETIFLPVFEPSELDFFETNWAVFGHLKQTVAESSLYSAAQKNIVSGIAIQDDSGVTSRSLNNSQAAVRVRGRAGEVDYGVYYLNLYHAVPVLKEKTSAGNQVKRFLFEPTVANLNALVAAGVSGDDLRLTKAHPRVNAVGLDWETVWGELGLRGEAAVFWGLPFLRDDFSYTEKDQVSFGIGVDHTTDSQWYFDVQYLQEFVLNYDGLYSMEEAPFAFAGSVAKDFWRGRFAFNLDWMWQASYADAMINPEITYKWLRGGIDFALGVFVFEGSSTRTLFGRYDQNDVVYAKVSGKF